MKFGNKKIAPIILLTAISIIILGGTFHFVSAGGVSGTWEDESGGSNSYIPLAPLPGTMDDKGQVNLNTYIPGIFNLVIGIAGVLAVLMVVIGGVEYMTTDAIGGKSEGKERINNALWGLLLVLVSWILLHTINPKLTIFDLNVEDQKIIQNQNKSVNTNDNFFINKGNSATELQQSSSSSINNKFKQQGSSSSNNAFMHSTE